MSVTSRFRRTPGMWRVLVPVVALLAGLLIATTAHAARGTNLRSAGQNNLADLIREAETKGNSADTEVRQLQAEIAAATGAVARSDQTIAQIDANAKSLELPAGLVAVTGSGLTVVLDDSHEQFDTADVDPNTLVVHQSDMQAVVNALWAGGAEAMQVQDQRIIQTSAIRCVGNTLLLNGRVYSPPFTISAIGDAQQMRRALNVSHNLSQYRKDAASYGLRYSVDDKKSLPIAAYEAPIGLNYAKIGN